jgi:hypothetical protein
MEHLERTLIEILRRLNDLERGARSSSRPAKNIIGSSSRSNTIYAKDHRFLENLNSENYRHITQTEYLSLRSMTNDHGLLDGLSDDDHKQYIRHNISVYDWDILAGKSDRTFGRKSIDELRNKISEKLFPEIDSENAITFYKSNGETPVLTLDTLNSWVGVGVQPESRLHISGSMTVTNGDIDFSGSLPSEITSEQSLSLVSGKDIVLNASERLTVQSVMQSGSFARDSRGWQLSESGDADFRNVRVNKINARIVATGIEQFVGGRQTMCKSASPLAMDFTIPAPESEATLKIEPFADYPMVNVFDDGDIVRISYTSLFDGEYNTSECWGSVVSAPSSSREQVYTFTRSAAPNSGDANAGLVVAAGELVLNYGSSGMGYIVSTVV